MSSLKLNMHVDKTRFLLINVDDCLLIATRNNFNYLIHFYIFFFIQMFEKFILILTNLNNFYE